MYVPRGTRFCFYSVPRETHPMFHVKRSFFSHSLFFKTTFHVKHSFLSQHFPENYVSRETLISRSNFFRSSIVDCRHLCTCRPPTFVQLSTRRHFVGPSHGTLVDERSSSLTTQCVRTLPRSSSQLIQNHSNALYSCRRRAGPGRESRSRVGAWPKATCHSDPAVFPGG